MTASMSSRLPGEPPGCCDEWVAWWLHDGRLCWVASFATRVEAHRAVVRRVEQLWDHGTDEEWLELHTELHVASGDWSGSSASAMDSFAVFQATPVLADIFIGNIQPHLGMLR